MSIWRLVLRELAHRKLNFVVALLSVAVAVGCFVGALTLLKAEEFQVRQAAAELEVAAEELEAAAIKHEDDMRKITKGLGFNIVVLGEDEDLLAFSRTGLPTATMPESHVAKLAGSDIVTINHLLPIVTREVEWPETGERIVLTGTRGEVPFAHRAMKKPLQDRVPRGTAIVGFRLARELDLKEGDTTKLMGREFQVSKVRPELGDVQDSTVWVNLEEAQEMFGLQNLVHAILALECNCATVDRLAEIREDIAAILPGTKIIERGTSATARAKARVAAEKLAKENQREAAERKEAAVAQLRQRRDAAALLIATILLTTGAWIALLFLANARQRSGEIGILRAMGVRSGQVVLLFLAKAVLIGLGGAVLGYLAGFFIASPWAELPAAVSRSALFVPWVLVTALALAPLLSAVASWIPAVLAARQDPAVVLQHE